MPSLRLVVICLSLVYIFLVWALFSVSVLSFDFSSHSVNSFWTYLELAAVWSTAVSFARLRHWCSYLYVHVDFVVCECDA